jgi:hypothetical protein
LKKALQQIVWAIVFGLGIPGVILGIAAEANQHRDNYTDVKTETSAWVGPLETTDSN